jgi:sugar phosphate permease
MRRWRARIFAVSWLSYFSYYFARKNWSVVKKPLSEMLGLSIDDLKLIDTLYLAAYSIGQFVNGFLGDWLGPRRLVGFGMLASAALGVAFGAGDALAIFAITFGLNGFAQSTGWPGNNRLMASWFGTMERGAVMGIWATCYQAGGLAATSTAGILLVVGGWRAAYIGNALWVGVVGVAVLLLIRDTPAAAGLEPTEPATPGADADTPTDTDAKPSRRLRAPRRDWARVVRSPIIWALGLNYFCMKLTRYSLLFWLPFYFSEALDMGAGAAAFMSTSFEIGGVLGVIAAGLVADKLAGRRRVAVAACMTTLLALALSLYAAIGTADPALNFVVMMLVGACLFGPDSLVSGAVAQDVGGPGAAALACGMVNGLGSLGAMLQGFVVAWVSVAMGWDTLFIVFQILAVISTLALLPFFSLRPGTPARSAA